MTRAPTGIRPSVVTGVVHRAVQDTIQAIDAKVLVELVRVPLVGRNLDDRVHFVRRVGCGRNVMPRVELAGRNAAAAGQIS